MQHVPLNGEGRFLFNVQDAEGNLTPPDVQGTITLYSDGDAQGTPGEAVTITGSAGTYQGRVDFSDASLKASGFFEVGDIITAAIAGIEVDGETNIGGWFEDSIKIGNELDLPESPELCTCWFYAIGADGEPEALVDFSVRLAEGDGTEGFSLDTTRRELVSDDEGLVQFQALRGKRYVVWRGESYWHAKPFTVPDADTYAIPEFLGTP